MDLKKKKGKTTKKFKPNEGVFNLIKHTGRNIGTDDPRR